MRFTNWDVLLFPEDSRIPIQEFEVKCQALPQYHERPVPNRLLALAGDNHQNSITHVPTLTCFVSSLDEGRPFRVSIHTWEKPKASELLHSFRPTPDRILFEAKLFIDGQLKAQRYMGDQNIWPEIIDSVADDDLMKALRFPPFHTEILRQSHWDAGDSLGRIRIVISEGISRPSGFPDVCGFDKLREVIVFSFQHAPKHILEYSGIAWPNARMFDPSPSKRDNNNFDTHAHSPRKPSSTISRNEKQSMKVANSKHPSQTLNGSKWLTKNISEISMAEDPFIDSARNDKSQNQSGKAVVVSKKDISASTKTHSDMSGVEMENAGPEQNGNNSNVQVNIESLTPATQGSLFYQSSPSMQNERDLCGMSSARPLSHSSVHLLRNSKPDVLSRGDRGQIIRRHSNESRRSASGRSGRMSWEETPTLASLWPGSNSDFPGLLPSISPSGNYRSTSVGSKRKRSLSPINLLSTASDGRSNTKGMSTSPQKATPTPLRSVDDTKAPSH